MRTQTLAALCLLLSAIAGSAASSLATFQDSECKKSANTVVGQDGYPDGVCTDMKEAAEGAYQSFMFITLDSGCTPTIYQNNTTSDTCSGAAYIAYISECYNTSWAYYSIDECTPLTSGSATTSTAAVASSSDNGISGGAIAGAVVGGVCGLGIIAAVCVYFFWFRPKQKEKARKEKEDAENKARAEAQNQTAAGDQNNEEGVLKAESPKPQELMEQPAELQSPDRRTELPNEGIVEAPGDKGGVEVDNDAQVPAELPGDHEYRSSDSR